MFDSRQLATLILLGALVVWALSSNQQTRKSVASLLRKLAHPRILIPFLLYLMWLAGLHWVTWRVGLWAPSLLGESIFWTGATGFGLLVAAVTEAGKEDSFFRDRAIETIKLGALFEFFLNIKSFSLIGELLFQPIFALLVGARVILARHDEYARIRRLLDIVLSLTMVGLVFYTAGYLVHDWSQIDKGQEIRMLLMPIWLTLGAMPFAFVLALIGHYGQLFSRMKATTGLKNTSLRARLGMLLSLRFRLRDIYSFNGRFAQQAGRARSVQGGITAVRDFRVERAAKAADEKARRERLKAYAGVKGVDGAGRQLDRREFDETKAALHWIAVCQMGWHNNRKRYRDDLLTFVNNFQRQGLPENHGIQLKVREDGQAWFAYRRTVSGWVLGIGSSKGTPDQWFYDGPEPPISFPHSGDGWGEMAHMETVNWGGR